MGRSPISWGSSDCSPRVLIPGHDRELFAPHFSSVGSFLRLKLADVMHVESICLPDKLVELLEGQKRNGRAEYKVPQKRQGTPRPQLIPLTHRKGDMKHPSHPRAFADVSPSTRRILFLSPQHLLLTQLTLT